MSDLKQAVEALRRQLRFFHIGVDIDLHSMILGLSSPFIKLYRHLLCEYDNEVSLFLSSNNFLLSETEDHRFMESLYRICRDVFSMKPPLSLAQFLKNSFAAKKLKMAAEIVKAVGELQKDLCRKTPKKRGVCALSAGAGEGRQTANSSSSQRASHEACEDGVNTIFLQSSQQSQPSPTRHSRLPIPSQQTDTTLPPTADAKLLCANDPLDPGHPHRSKRGSSPSIAKDSSDSVKNDYLSGLLTNLNMLSNQLSQIIDRVAGIESRVFAIEQPMRKAATNQAGLLVDKAKLKAKDKHDSHNGEWAGSHIIAGLPPDLVGRSDRFYLVEKAKQKPSSDILNSTTERQLVYCRGWHPQYQSPPSDTSALAEINDHSLSSKPSINTSVASSSRFRLQNVPGVSISGRYSPEFTGFPKTSIHKEERNYASTNPTTEAHVVPTAVHNSVFRQTLEQDASLCQPSSVLQSKSDAYRSFPIVSHIESGCPGGGDDLTVFPEQPTARFTNGKDGPASTMERANSSNNSLDVDRGLKQQVNRILNMLTETQDLLESRRPLSTR
ncbi:Centrosomal protein of 44 kDa [Taenia crassiceps]|uniref:Centrosomal protein of 44 kDa n=1 Tax=Taenia crassiceps TaxID=6207 RepID=A0ABR4QR67_9CEST